MSSVKRNAVITAVVLIILGILLCGWVYYKISGDFSRLNTAHFEPKTMEVNEIFRSIDIRETEYDVNIVLLENAEDVTCRVETSEAEGLTSSVKVDNGVLRIIREDNRRWYDHIGFFWNDEPEVVTVYLPDVWFEDIDDSYDDLTIKTVSGDVSVPRNFSFRNVNIATTSGDVDMAAGVSQDWSVKTTSGDVTILHTGGWKGSINTVSGEVRAYNVCADKLDIATTSGDVCLDRTGTTAAATISTTSGDVELLSADARSFDISTVSGDVSGDIGIRNFDISTVSGEADIPGTDENAGLCRIKTTSGDIELK